MKVGINIAECSDLEYLKLLPCSNNGFVEILLDNFLHLPPEQLKNVFPENSVAFHIMGTKFLEVNACTDSLIDRIKEFAEVLKPLYISDHIARFSAHSMQFPQMMEVDYVNDFERVAKGIAAYQERLGSRLYLENFPSTLSQKVPQPKFYADLVRSTGCGVLFDASNAAVAQLNGSCPSSMWFEEDIGFRHAHIGGYRYLQRYDLYLDSHDGYFSPLSFDILRDAALSGVETTVFEWDDKKSTAAWKHGINQIKNISNA